MRKKISVPCIFAERNEKSVRQGAHSASSAVASATISPRASTHNHVFCTIGNEISYRTKKCRLVTNRHFHKFRAGKGTRTLDLLITNQLRYQLRYSSNLPTLFIIKANSLFDKSIFSFYLKIFHQIYFNDKTCYLIIK